MMNRALPAIAACLVLFSPTVAHAAGDAPEVPVPAAPASTPSKVIRQFNTITELMGTSGLSGTVRTKGHASAGDGAGMTFSIKSHLPSGITAAMAVPLADGKWAVPQNLPRRPATRPNSASVRDEVVRARTFAAAGKDLIWDPTRQTPLSNTIVHAHSRKPYALTCSSFVGMVLKGWDYRHTTYVADRNTRVGDWVDFKAARSRDLWQAHKLARWFYANGDLWLDAGAGAYRRGDLLFFSQRDPEGAGTSGNYFGNVYHVGIYLGDGRIIHSTGASAKAGVVEEELSDSLRADLSFVARPTWRQSNRPPTPPPMKPTPVPVGASTAEPVASAADDPATAEENEVTPSDQAPIQAEPDPAGTLSDEAPASPSDSPSTPGSDASPLSQLSEVPTAGPPVGLLAGGAVALLGAGGVVVGLVRRRRTADTPPETPTRTR